MKLTLRIPTQDQYAFVECELNIGLAGQNVPPEEVKELYDVYAGAFKIQEGLPSKDFDKFLDKYLGENTGDVEIYNGMNQDQKDRIQMLKRAFKRIEARQMKVEIAD